ncbi:hypothetical protein VPH35_088887 [Triticum aestivum]|uniref:uncharacterized protein n=1 Tax=Triticum aestivum TaxID=4565 RepID=UPI001D0262E2|nr:uncharacterized protein LOC123115867 [Triticum aestivum]
MHLLHGSAMIGGSCGGRALRRVDSSPKPSLCRSDAMKKKRSKRSRLPAALRELRLAAKARDKEGLLQILVTGHRTSRGGSGNGERTGGASTERSVAGTGDDQRATLRWQGRGVDAAARADGPLLELGRPTATGGASCGGRRCPSWALAVALVLALVCVVALGTAPAICCCTCAAWLCGGCGAQEHASDRRRGGSCRGSVRVIQQQAGSTLYHAEVTSG